MADHVPVESASGPEPPYSKEVERIFREHNDSLVRFIAGRLGSRQEAAEVAQEAYVKLLSLGEPQAVSFLRAFLFKIAINLATDRLRSRARHANRSAQTQAESTIFELSPEREVNGEQMLERLREAIGELPTKSRQAFLMYRMEELSCEEIAARLGLQERMVWRHIARALEYLRSRVDEDARTNKERKS